MDIILIVFIYTLIIEFDCLGLFKKALNEIDKYKHAPKYLLISCDSP